MARTNGTPDKLEVFDFFAASELVTIYLDPGNRIWVRLITELDFGQQSDLEAASLRGVTVRDAKAAVEQQQMMVFDLGHQRRLKLATYIEDWSLPMKWPASLDERYQLVKRLKPKWATVILEEIEKLEAAAIAALPDSGRDEEPDPNVVAATGRPILEIAPGRPSS